MLTIAKRAGAQARRPASAARLLSMTNRAANAPTHMVFEGKPIHPKKDQPMAFEGKPIDAATKATFEGKPLEKPVEPIQPPKAAKANKTTFEGEPLPKKTHRFRNFVLTTLALTTLVYGGGAYYSLENDDVHDYFVDNLPLADELMAFIENRRFRKRFSTIAVQQTPARGNGGLERASNAGAVSRPVTEAPVTAAPKQLDLSKLPLVPVPANADKSVQASIEALNEFISSINDKTHTSEHISKISDKVVALSQSIAEIKAGLKADLAAKVETKSEAVADTVADKTQELRAAIAAQEAKWAAEFREEKTRLEASYNERLKNEIDAASSVIAAHADNQLAAVHAEAERQFAAEISRRIEQERDGRLANLEQLAKTLADIEELTVKSDSVLLDADSTAQLHIAIGHLRTALSGDKPVALGPYIQAVAKAAASKNDLLLQAALNSIPKEVHDQGVLTPAQLAARFHLLEPELRKASLLPPNAGIAGHLGSLVLSKLLWTKSESSVDESASDVESVLARANRALSEGRTTDAVGEVNALKGWPKRLAQDWLAEGRKRSEVEFLVDVLAEESKLWGLEI